MLNNREVVFSEGSRKYLSDGISKNSRVAHLAAKAKEETAIWKLRRTNNISQEEASGLSVLSVLGAVWGENGWKWLRDVEGGETPLCRPVWNNLMICVNVEGERRKKKVGHPAVLLLVSPSHTNIYFSFPSPPTSSLIHWNPRCHTGIREIRATFHNEPHQSHWARKRQTVVLTQDSRACFLIWKQFETCRRAWACICQAGCPNLTWFIFFLSQFLKLVQSKCPAVLIGTYWRVPSDAVQCKLINLCWERFNTTGPTGLDAWTRSATRFKGM